MNHPVPNRPPLSVVSRIPSFVAGQDYSSAFGLQWNTWAKTQLDSHTGLPITRDRMKRMFGALYAQLKGKLVLEAGCGAGRFTEILLDEGALVTAFDLSSAVIANQENNGDHPNLFLLQASATDIPFDEGLFDYVFCPGVVQHTPDPSKTIQSLWNQVRPGGWLIYDQYRHTLSTWTRTAWIVRLPLKRLSAESGLKLTNALVRIFLPLHKRVAHHRVLEKILFRFSPITAHYSGYPEMSDEDQIAWAQLNTHDNLTDYFKHHTTIKKMKSLVANLGAVQQFYTIMPYTIEVRIQKPAATQLDTKEILVQSTKRTNLASG